MILARLHQRHTAKLVFRGLDSHCSSFSASAAAVDNKAQVYIPFCLQPKLPLAVDVDAGFEFKGAPTAISQRWLVSPCGGSFPWP
jgi:hypothetical protein